MRFKFLKGFTLAEVLITLGVIGVVAAMTIPTVMTAYQKHMVETRLKHVYSTILQSFKMIQAQYGDVSFNVDDTWSYDNSKQVFDEFFAPVFVGVTAIPKTQRYYAYSPNGNKFSTDNQAVWYSLANGTVIGFAKPGAVDGVSFIVVLNPQKQRTISGRDYFIFTFSADNNGEYRFQPMIDKYYSKDREYEFAQYCKSETSYPAYSTSPPEFCTVLLVKNNFKIPASYPIKF